MPNFGTEEPTQPQQPTRNVTLCVHVDSQLIYNEIYTNIIMTTVKCQPRDFMTNGMDDGVSGAEHDDNTPTPSANPLHPTVGASILK